MVLRTKKKGDSPPKGITSQHNDIITESDTNVKDFLFNPSDYNEEEEVLISIQGKNIGSVGNAVVITGKPKSRKSVVAHSIIGAGISKRSVLGIECNIDSPSEIILVDTEQSKHDLKKSLTRMASLVNMEELPDMLKVYTFRTLDPDRIKKAIQQILLNRNIKLMIIDGGLDLINNMNDVLETKATIQFVKEILSLHKICLVMIIHQSKASNYTIGHFGSFMDRFVQTNIEVTRMENGNSEVKAQLMRSDDHFKPYEFYWNHNEENYSINWVESLEITAKHPYEFTDDQHEKKLEIIYNNVEIMTYTKLSAQLMESYKKSEYWCKKLIKYLTDRNILTKSDGGIRYNKLNF